jgi:hypothetical protein
MLLRVPGGISAEGFPAIVTVPRELPLSFRCNLDSIAVGMFG